MKIVTQSLIVLGLLISPISYAEENFCTLNVFGKEIVGSGNSPNTARVDVRLKCVFDLKNNPMFCKFKDMKCSTIQREQYNYCEIEALGKLYYSLRIGDSNLASEEAVTSCLKENNTMFCKREQVTCFQL